MDYNGGPVLPTAIDRHVSLTARSLEGRVVNLSARDLGESVAFHLDHLDEKLDLQGNPLPVWALYPAGVAWALQTRGLVVTAIEADFHSNIPIGAGLSSSAAIEAAFAVLWQTLGGWKMDRMDLAIACQQAETGYIGVQCGLMDQFICLHGIAGHALLFDTLTLAWEAYPLPSVALVVANSNIPHTLTSSAYNQRQAECQQALEILQGSLAGIRTLGEVSLEQFERYASLLPDVIRQRARHVVEECDRVPRAAACLKAGDLEGFGEFMLAGHASLRDHYAVSCPEIDFLVDTASSLPGCFGARLTGAGFGGCTVNLVDPAYASEFVHLLKQEYDQQTPYAAEIFLTSAVAGAQMIG